ncbi:lipoprotein LpqH [Mycolicibacterium sp.]|uniref:lipoprotein LpqH n=1 Tax=Mycolicibacterium sp. TaxID=2320850 RepID=UPI003D0CA2D5
MKREFLVAVGGIAVTVGALAGCSSDDEPAGGSSPTSETAAEATVEATVEATATTESPAESPATPAATAGATRVSIDGQDQDVQGTVVCQSAGGNLNIAIGDAATGIAAVLSEADPPAVNSVALGNVNGVTLGFTSGVPGASAEATKDGDTYTITGTATGVDMANPMQPVNKPFEIQVSCP